jgi:integrase
MAHQSPMDYNTSHLFSCSLQTPQDKDMATIQKRKNKNGTTSYRVMIRLDDGLPATYKTFPTFQEAKEWSIQEEAKRRQGTYFPESVKKKHTVTQLIDRYSEYIRPDIKTRKDILRQLTWWKNKIGQYSLNHITPDFISRYKQELLNEKTSQGKLRTKPTVNRYLSALSSVLTYAVKECGWLTTNPMFRVCKLKESKGRDRVLTQHDIATFFSPMR